MAESRQSEKGRVKKNPVPGHQAGNRKGSCAEKILNGGVIIRRATRRKSNDLSTTRQQAERKDRVYRRKKMRARREKGTEETVLFWEVTHGGRGVVVLVGWLGCGWHPGAVRRLMNGRSVLWLDARIRGGPMTMRKKLRWGARTLSENQDRENRGRTGSLNQKKRRRHRGGASRQHD